MSGNRSRWLISIGNVLAGLQPLFDISAFFTKPPEIGTDTLPEPGRLPGQFNWGRLAAAPHGVQNAPAPAACRMQRPALLRGLRHGPGSPHPRQRELAPIIPSKSRGWNLRRPGESHA